MPLPAVTPSPSAIEGHAAIGDCRTLALVRQDGEIDWCCLPGFSSPSVFAALLDDERGGRCSMAPAGVSHTEQAYEPRSNVLLTRFHCDGGVLELHDFMTAQATSTVQDGIVVVDLAPSREGRAGDPFDALMRWCYDHGWTAPLQLHAHHPRH